MFVLGTTFFVLASALALSPMLWIPTVFGQIVVVAIAPFTVSALFMALCAVMARLFLRASRRATLVSEKDWARELYCISWALFERTMPIYFMALRWNWSRWLVFRFFGYAGEMNFQLSPGARLSELPWIQLAQGSSVKEHAALTPSLTLSTGQVLTQAIQIGRSTEIGLAARLFPGVQIKEECRLGARTTLGMSVRLESGAKVGDGACLDRGVLVGEGASIARNVYLGAGAKVGAYVALREGASVADGVAVETQGAADKLWIEETVRLNNERARALRIVFLREYQ